MELKVISNDELKKPWKKNNIAAVYSIILLGKIGPRGFLEELCARACARFCVRFLKIPPEICILG